MIGRKLEDIIDGVNNYSNSGAWEAEFLANPERFAVEHGLLPGEASRLRRWLAKDPCYQHRPPGCPYLRLCARCQKREADIRAYHDERRRLTSGLEASSLGSFAQHGILDEGVVVLAPGGNELRAHRSAITGNRAFIEVSDGGDATYVTLFRRRGDRCCYRTSPAGICQADGGRTAQPTRRGLHRALLTPLKRRPGELIGAESAENPSTVDLFLGPRLGGPAASGYPQGSTYGISWSQRLLLLNLYFRFSAQRRGHRKEPSNTPKNPFPRGSGFFLAVTSGRRQK
jgi:hypothetical protein